jgi:hypothetical protein
MRLFVRVALTFVSGVAALYFVYWVGGALLLSLALPPWVASVVAVAVAVLVVRYVWRHTESLEAGLASSVAVGALVLGGIGFTAGFFGPMFLAPEANQGPLLGIFITGPLGFVLGAVAGAVRWFVRRRRAPAPATALPTKEKRP